MMTLSDFKIAREFLKNILLPNHLVASPYFSNKTGGNIYFKPENMQLTGSYKVRGASFKVSTLSEEQRACGVVTASAGNHAQGVAFAAKTFGMEATVIMPEATPLVKVNNTRDYGAKVMLVGSCFDDSAAYASKMAEETGMTYIHPFNDLTVSTGQGTIGYEIFQDLPDVDIILAPIGGGGLISGVATLAKLLNPSVRIIGVEPTGAASMQAALEAGNIVTIPSADTIADGVAVRTVGDKIFPYAMENIDDIITVDDTELVAAFLDMMEKHKMIVENAGLLTVAALSHLDCRGKNIVSILSGGNMDIITMDSLVEHGLVQRGRVFTISLELPDRPGALAKLTNFIAEQRASVVKLDHNRFISVNRQQAVGIKITLEAFGHEHKAEIISALTNEGYKVTELSAYSI